MTRFLLAAWLLIAAPAFGGTTYYVNAATGNDSNAGTSAGSPWLTLAKATYNSGVLVVAGDSVIVKAGIYTDPNGDYDHAFTPANSGSSGSPIVYRSDPQFAAILRPSGRAGAYTWLPFGRNYITIDGFRSEGSLGAQGSGEFSRATGIVIKNCEVIIGRPNQSDPSTNFALALIDQSGSRLTNNYVHDVVSSGNESHNTAAIMIFHSDNCTIENNDANCANGSNRHAVYSSYGQKGGNIYSNIYRYNIARNGYCGFLGMGSTDETKWSESNRYYSNIVINAQDAAWEYDHKTRNDSLYNNTLYNCRAMIQADYNDTDNITKTSFNNIMANTFTAYGSSDPEHTNSPSGYHRSGSADFDSNLLTYSNYNCFVPSKTIAMADYGSTLYSTLTAWRAAYSTLDQSGKSIAAVPLFADSAAGNFHLSTSSPCRSTGLGGVDMGAYPTRTEIIGLTSVLGVAPVLTQPTNMSVNEIATTDQVLNATDANGDPLTFSKVSGPSFETVTTTTPGTGTGIGNIHLSPGAGTSGTYSSTVRVSDGTLANDKTLQITVGVTSGIPVLTQPSDMTLNEGATADQGITATDPNGDPLTFTKQGGAFFATVTTTSPGTGTGTGNIHLTPGFDNSGSYSLTVRASDGVLRDEKTLSITVNNVNRTPTFTSPENMIVTEGLTSDQELYAFDPDGDTVTFSKVSGASFVTVSTVSYNSGNIHLAPSIGDAASSPFAVTVRASDGTLNTDKALSVVVLPAAFSSVCTPF